MFRDQRRDPFRHSALAACCSGLALAVLSGCALDAPATEDAPAESRVRLHVRLPGAAASAQQGAAVHSLLAPAPIEYDEITTILVDVHRELDGASLLVDVPLAQDEFGAWSVELPFLPRGEQLRFHAEAFDALDELGFRGDTLVTLTADAQDVAVPLRSLQDGESYAIPRIEAIRYPAEIATGQEVQIVFSLAGNQGQQIIFALDTESGQGSFQPEAGTVTLNGAVTDFIVLYTAPELSTNATLAHTLTLRAAQGLSAVVVETHFDTAIRTTEPGTVLDTTSNVRFNPVVRSLTVNGTSEPGSVILSADVSDDGPAEDLSYAWTYSPAEGTPAGSFAAGGTGNPGVFEGYTVAHEGTLSLDVSDADGGLTTLSYELMPAQFADVIVDDPAAGLARVVAGRAHTCALTGDGRVRCWGDNAFGQLGYGNTSNVGDSIERLPYASGDVPLVEPAKQLVVGDDHTCALTLAGAVVCWGKNSYGQLGLGHTDHMGDNEPVQSFWYATIDGTATRIAAGGDHTCAIVDGAGVTSELYCWGRNDFGQLGSGTSEHQGDDEDLFGLAAVPLDEPVLEVALGHTHTCARLESGAVRCWGQGTHGQLGYGSGESLGDDEAVSEIDAVALPGPVRKLVAGDAHTCALLDDGGVRCWGQGAYGALGQGTTDDWGDDAGETPGALASDVATGGHVVDIAAGARHTCALLSSSGLTCWGAGSAGRLGYGDDGDRNAPGPALGLGTTAAFQVTAGQAHTCVLDNAGTARCWGLGDSGRLGTGTQAVKLAAADALSVPVLTEDGGCSDEGEDSNQDGVPDACNSVIAVVAGGNHTCALLDTGRVRCWGKGSSGQLGYANENDIGDYETPAAVADVDVGGDVVQLALGNLHTCALLRSGRVRCWGRNNVGQLGYAHLNDIGDDETPASAGDVDVGGTVLQIAAGTYHTCALLDTGSVRCWGTGSSGRLGYGNLEIVGNDETPASVGDVDVGGPVIQLALGNLHTCALLASGKVRCWGENEDGQLGYGNSVDIGDNETPASVGDVAIDGRVVQVVAGNAHTCARLATGQVRCWGDGTLGRLGNRTSAIQRAPGEDARLGAAALSLQAGATHTCAVLEHGALRCWGAGDYYALGTDATSPVGDNEYPDEVAPVDLGGPLYAVTAGTNHTCALQAGQVRCWGSNSAGKLGYATVSLFLALPVGPVQFF
ncbi:chromosome condensation regulator [Haliangium ochraceum]|uniref:Regulator of chromosome condensation RCC1 n=1 Tax=Haliangium ochraceum (strain DSM 14365 / JCM 11303 / SMP-2) TaxID=502025 RepID=D0LRZ2_HALO1|nr:chromosome condensation regulator [Haliangium ochraceum]ACY13689.1 regulator of chromosome condensation RCC1 [Haliangium ochraceum DSM 14365]